MLSMTRFKSNLIAEFWSLVVFGGTGVVIYVVARGWFADTANILGLLVGAAAAAAGLIGAAYSEGRKAGH